MSPGYAAAPGVRGAEGGAHIKAGGPETSVPTDAAASTERAADACFRHAYAILVRGKTVRRHLYFNLPAAERAVRRAMMRGDQASMLLVELVPVADRFGPVCHD